jgi:hypothetical protein
MIEAFSPLRRFKTNPLRFLPPAAHNGRKVCLDTPSSIHLSKKCCTVEALCVEIDTNFSCSPLQSATLSVIPTTNTLFYAGFVVWHEKQTAPLFFI